MGESLNDHDCDRRSNSGWKLRSSTVECRSKVESRPLLAPLAWLNALGMA